MFNVHKAYITLRLQTNLQTVLNFQDLSRQHSKFDEPLLVKCLHNPSTAISADITNHFLMTSIHSGTFSQSSELKMDKIKSHPTLFPFNILVHSKKCQITQAQWVANAILCWHNQIELVLSGFKKKTQWSQTVIWHTKRDQQVIITTPLCADKLTDKPTDCSSIVRKKKCSVKNVLLLMTCAA